MIDADALERKLMVMPDEELCEDCCYNVINEIDKMPTVGGWISVKDRLPDAAGVEVLVLAHNNYYDTYVMFIAFLAYGEIKWCTYDTTKMTLERPTDNTVNERLTITHWMPLPELPEEDDGK
jgi:hypothetical protein